MEKYYGVVKVAIALITFVGGIYSVYYRLSYIVKRQSEKIDATEQKLVDVEQKFIDVEKKREYTIKEERQARERALEKLLITFKEGLKYEISHLNIILTEQKNNIEKIWNRVDEMSDLISRVDEKLDSHIKNQKTICSINHKWNGMNRRKD